MDTAAFEILSVIDVEKSGATAGSKNCTKAQVPMSSVYWSKYLIHSASYLTVTIICLITAVYIVALYCVKFYYIRVYVSSIRRASKMTWVAAIFPVTAVLCCVGICMPRALQVVDIFIYLYFTRCLFTFVQLIADYFGGELEMAKFLRDDPIRMNTLPCCCCLVCLPQAKPTRELLRRVGILVYQVAILPPLIFFLKAIIFVDQIVATKKSLFVKILFPTLSILQLVSILLASYGTQIFTKMAAVSLQDYCIKTQMRFVQFMIILYNIQGDVFNVASNFLGLIPCTPFMPAADLGRLWNHYLLVFEIFILATMAAWLLRPNVNATFDLHDSQLETHAANRKIALFEEDYYIHDEELAENVPENAARRRWVHLADALLDTDALKRHSRNPFAPRPSYSLYGAGPNLNPNMPGIPTAYRNSINPSMLDVPYRNSINASSLNVPYKNSINPSSLDVPKISLLSAPPERSGRHSMSNIGNDSASAAGSKNRQMSMSSYTGNNRLMSISSSAGGENRRKVSLLDAHYLPKQISQGPWLKRLPTPSVSSDDTKTIRQRVMSISEEAEDEEDVFHGDQNDVKDNYHSDVESEPPPVVRSKSLQNDLNEIKPNGNPSVSVVEYLI